MKLSILGQFKPFGLSQIIDDKCVEVFLDKNPSKYFLMNSDDECHEEEIFISVSCFVCFFLLILTIQGRTVICSAQVVKKTFTMEFPIVKCIWASFEQNKPKNYLCILHKGRVHFIILFIISRGIKNIWI
jgi:hypothetical protein